MTRLITITASDEGLKVAGRLFEGARAIKFSTGDPPFVWTQDVNGVWRVDFETLSDKLTVTVFPPYSGRPNSETVVVELPMDTTHSVSYPDDEDDEDDEEDDEEDEPLDTSEVAAALRRFAETAISLADLL